MSAAKLAAVTSLYPCSILLSGPFSVSLRPHLKINLRLDRRTAGHGGKNLFRVDHSGPGGQHTLEYRHVVIGITLPRGSFLFLCGAPYRVGASKCEHRSRICQGVFLKKGIPNSGNVGQRLAAGEEAQIRCGKVRGRVANAVIPARGRPRRVIVQGLRHVNPRLQPSEQRRSTHRCSTATISPR
jgi:hypothetical protein